MSMLSSKTRLVASNTCSVVGPAKLPLSPNSWRKHPPTSRNTILRAETKLQPVETDVFVREPTDRSFEAGYRAGFAEATKSQESIQTSAAKSVVWRVFSTALTVLVVTIVVGDKVADEDVLAVGWAEVITKLVSYFIFERCWIACMAALPPRIPKDGDE